MKLFNRVKARPQSQLLVAVLTILCVSGTAVHAKKIKCWTNNDGVRECGNFVPPEFAQKGHVEKNSIGVTVNKSERAKSIEELEAERALTKQKAAAEQIARQQAAIEAAKDRVLLDTFSSEDDMLLARDGQLGHLESQVKITQSHIDKLKVSLDERISEAAGHERRGKEPPEKLLAEIKSLREQIKENEVFIDTKKTERASIEKKFEADISRFRKLKGVEETLGQTE